MMPPYTPTPTDKLRGEIMRLRHALRRCADFAKPAMGGDPRRAKAVLASIHEEAEAALVTLEPGRDER